MPVINLTLHTFFIIISLNENQDAFVRERYAIRCVGVDFFAFFKLENLSYVTCFFSEIYSKFVGKMYLSFFFI